MKTLNLVPALAMAVLSVVMAGCSGGQLPGGSGSNKQTRITASMAQEESASSSKSSRTCIDTNHYANNVVGLLWRSGDCIGVFGESSTKNAKFTTDDNTGQATFTGTMTTANEVPAYAYYPYSSSAGTTVTALKGTVGAEQTYDLATGLLTDDWKVGQMTRKASDGSYEFHFNHLFAMLKVTVTTSGFPEGIAEEKLDKLTFQVVNADGSEARLNGSFTFNAKDGSYTRGTDGTDTMTMVWNAESAPTLAGDGSHDGYITLMPDDVQSGDKFVVTLYTTNHMITYHLKSIANFESGYIYEFPISHSVMTKKMTEAYPDLGEPVVKNLDGTDYNPSTPAPDPDPTPEVTVGTFTCATYNVDGLKDISYIVGSINSDGPGADGTKKMGGKINSEYKWDFFGVSENFHYHTELEGALSLYSAGTWRGDVTSVSGNKDTDGLGFFWKTNGVTVSGESWTKFNQSAGGLTEGANTLISKGYRYYLVTLEDGTEVDVYITHMNTYGNDKRKEAQHAQLTQIADALLANDNGRPIIFMGDTNLRYTRHEIKTRLIDRINNTEGWSINDPWIDYMWDGDYEGVTNHGKSIMAYGPNNNTNADTDDFGPTGNGYGYQKGEIVDKVFYINRTTNATQIKANGYLCDESFGSIDGTAFGDHYPVVIEFTYTTTK